MVLALNLKTAFFIEDNINISVHAGADYKICNSFLLTYLNHLFDNSCFLMKG